MWKALTSAAICLATLVAVDYYWFSGEYYGSALRWGAQLYHDLRF
jgi:hypothetical protein